MPLFSEVYINIEWNKYVFKYKIILEKKRKRITNNLFIIKIMIIGSYCEAKNRNNRYLVSGYINKVIIQ